MAGIESTTYTNYLAALNFKPDDIVCVGFGRPKSKIQPGHTPWENFFMSFSALSLPEIIAKMTKKNEDGQDIYLSMAPFLPGTKKREKQFVAGVRHLFVDIDENGNAVREAVSADAVSGLIPKPNILVATSPGKGQMIWSADAGTFDIHKQEAQIRALQQHYKTDSATVDTARFLRMPGFVNNKYDDRPVVRLVGVNAHAPSRSEDFKIAPASAAVHKPVDASLEGDKIPHGQHDSELTRIAGKLREIGMEPEGMAEQLVKICEARCENYGSDYREMCEKIAHSIGKKPVGKDNRVFMGGVEIGTAQAAATELTPAPELDTSELADRPIFPAWIIDGTTIGEGLVKPALASSSKHAEFIFLPAVQGVINFLHGKIRMKYQTVNMNLFLGLISPYGKFFKSSSCELAHEYLKLAGIGMKYSSAVKNADATMVISGAGSPEGFGKLMSNLNAKHAMLYNDELGKFVAKASIDGSAFCSDLLSWWGSGDFGNTVKSTKDSFAFEAGSYCFSWLWCTTDRAFNRLWPKLAGISTGIEDRTFFVVGPEQPKVCGEYQDPQLQPGAIETRKAIDAAVTQGVFDCEYKPAMQESLKGLDDPRSQQLVQLLALYFAVDLQLSDVSGECYERARALVDYRNACAKYLEPIEGLNEQARLQKEIRRELRRNKGKMTYRGLCRRLNYDDYGMDMWTRSFVSMVKFGDLAEWEEAMPGAKRKTHMVGLVKRDE